MAGGQYMPVTDGIAKPSPQHPRAHRRLATVKQTHQSMPRIAGATALNLQIDAAYGINNDGGIVVAISEAADMRNMVAVQIAYILHQRPGRARGERKFIAAERGLVMHAEGFA